VRLLPIALRRATLCTIYHYISAQRGGEGSRLRLGHIAPHFSTWATPSAVAAGALPPTADELQIGPRGVKTRQRAVCGNIDLSETVDCFENAFIARLPLLLAAYEAEGVELSEDTPVFIRGAPAGHHLSSPPLPYDWNAFSRDLERYARPDDLGEGARPHSSRGSTLVQDGLDKVPRTASMARAMIKSEETLMKYQSRTRKRRGGLRTEGMRPRSAMRELTLAAIRGPDARAPAADDCAARTGALAVAGGVAKAVWRRAVTVVGRLRGVRRARLPWPMPTLFLAKNPGRIYISGFTKI
jgi:hypothetical protein